MEVTHIERPNIRGLIASVAKAGAFCIVAFKTKDALSNEWEDHIVVFQGDDERMISNLFKGNKKQEYVIMIEFQPAFGIVLNHDGEIILGKELSIHKTDIKANWIDRKNMDGSMDPDIMNELKTLETMNYGHQGKGDIN